MRTRVINTINTFLYHAPIFFIILLLCSPSCYGQYITQVQKFSVADGLPHRNVSSIHIDRQNFVWASTAAGLAKFDGIQFRIFNKKNGLQANHIQHIEELEDGRFIIKFTGKDMADYINYFDVFDPTTETSLKLKDAFPELVASMKHLVNNHFIDALENTLIAYNGRDSMLIYNIFERKVRTLFHSTGTHESLGNIEWIRKIREDIYWIHSYKIAANGERTQWMTVFDHKKQHLKKYELATPTMCRPIATDNSGNIWMSKAAGRKKGDNLYILSTSGKLDTFHFEQYVSTNKNKIAYNPLDSTVWILGSDSTITLIDRNGELLYKSHKINAQLFRGVRALTFDNQGILWVSTHSGILKITITPSKFKTYLSKNTHGFLEIVEKSTRHLQVADNGKIYISASQNLYEVTPGKVPAVKNLSYLFPSPKTNGCKPSGMSVFLESDSILWTTVKNCSQYLVARINLQNESVEYISPPYEGYNIGRFMGHIIEDKLLVGGINGVGYVDTKKMQLIDLKFEAPFEGLNNRRITHIHKNKKGLWLATSKGLYLLDYSFKVRQWWHSSQHPTDVFDEILHIHEDEKGIFWMASRESGLIEWKPFSATHQQYTTADGLSHNYLYGVYEDKANNLWISSDMGLMCFNKSTKLTQTYLLSDGIPSNEFNTWSHYQDKNGHLYFGGLNGIVQFDPAEILSASVYTHQAPLRITSLERYGFESEDYTDLTLSFLASNIIEILPEDRQNILRFALLDYHNPQQNQYAYKIVPLDEDWRYLKSPKIIMGKLPYGPHTLLIKAKSPHGAWQPPIEIKMHVVLPFYLNQWFIGFIIITLILLVFLFLKWRLSISKKREIQLEAIVSERTAQIKEDKKIIEQQAEELKALDQLKSRFFANISHELRTPLTLILGPLAQTLESAATDPWQLPPTLRKRLQSMQRNGQSLLRLVEEILDLSKLDANQLELKLQRTNLPIFARNMHYRIQPQADYKQIQLETEFQLTPGLEIQTDPDKLEKMIINLLSNALKFTPKGGTIQFRILHNDNILKIQVSDTGKGIAASDLPHIFDRFYQSKNPDSASANGTGIGLAFVKELVELMNGTITADSIVGKGSNFEITIPATPLPKTIQSTEGLSPQQLPHFSLDQIKNAHILIVEDTPDMRHFIEELLQPHFNIQSVPNGQKALDYLKNTTALPDLILSDMMMPEMNGFELLEHLKKSTLWHQIPVIMLTARAAERDKLTALTIGVDDYMTKPFSPKELLLRVRNLLGNALLRQQNIQKQPEAEEKKASVEEAAPATVLKKNDQNWIKEVEAVLIQHIDDPKLDANKLAKLLNTSKSTLSRKLKKVIGLSPGQYIRTLKMQTARRLLEEGQFQSVSEVGMAVGFDAPYYFSEIFEKHFGKKITDFL